MASGTLVILKTVPCYVPLSWTGWSLTWAGEFASAKAVCHLLMPDNAAHREQLWDVYLSRESVPCVLHDPVRNTWYWFDAYLTTYDLRADLEVTLIADGEVHEGTPLPPRRTQATRRRKLRAAPVPADEGG